MYLKTEKGKSPKIIRNITNIPITYLPDSSFIFAKLGLSRILTVMVSGKS